MATKSPSGNVRTIQFYHRGESHVARVGFYRHTRTGEFIRVDGRAARERNYNGGELIGIGADAVPRADGSGANAEELTAMGASSLASGFWEYVPRSKVPANWRRWFDAHPAQHRPSRPNGAKARKAPRSAAQKRATAKLVARNKAASKSRTRRNPEVECREPKKKIDRYRTAKVWNGHEWIQLEGCHSGSKYVGRAEGAKKRTTISKKVVRQKASRTPHRVKGVKARKRS